MIGQSLTNEENIVKEALDWHKSGATSRAKPPLCHGQPSLNLPSIRVAWSLCVHVRVSRSPWLYISRNSWPRFQIVEFSITEHKTNIFKTTKGDLKVKFKKWESKKGAPKHQLSPASYQPVWVRLQRVPKSSLVTRWPNWTLKNCRWDVIWHKRNIHQFYDRVWVYLASRYTPYSKVQSIRWMTWTGIFIASLFVTAPAWNKLNAFTSRRNRYIPKNSLQQEK